MITSDVFLQFHDCGNPLILAHLLCSNLQLTSYSHRASFVEPNYGPLWYYCMELSISSSTEVIIRAANMNTYVIAHDADLYYHALDVLTSIPISLVDYKPTSSISKRFKLR
ncbi:hypothetical protein JH06_1572 [Blastocystis sp. subtype 4]|uniref:hypothetical protein n=1 Tax=Blastocystis sp. subtype 4 TaxID=944170 RepID=UPI000711CB55|nr:hypothetical protein JH06_1572 [Blastocystis sp. subtype 4]KNB44692.1 hypothetical protein JH06_1572 [Blastocystis sp. subtype 4]|eukprot:XP_014528135.1 hypothetical protein JH06_1572 [Blastocystis sp. subtype 4]